MKGIILAFALALVTPATSQVPQCAIKDAPEVRGFKLGMSEADALKRFSDIQISADEFGKGTVSILLADFFGDAHKISPSLYAYRPSSLPGLEGVKSIKLEFLDHALVGLTVGYDQTVKWRSVDEFASAVSGPLDIKGRWEKVDTQTGYPGQRIKCDGFYILATGEGIDMNMSLTVAADFVENITASRKAEKEKKEAEEAERRRKEFRP